MVRLEKELPKKIQSRTISTSTLGYEDGTFNQQTIKYHIKESDLYIIKDLLL